MSIISLIRNLTFIEILDPYCAWRNSFRLEHDNFSFVPGPPGATFAYRKEGAIITYNQDHCIVVIADIADNGFCLFHSSQAQINSEIVKLNKFLNGKSINIFIVANKPEDFIGLFSKGTIISCFRKNERCVASLIVRKSDNALTIKIGQQFKLLERNNWLKYISRIPRCKMKKVKFERVGLTNKGV
jgi:hypothetical protein